MTTDAPLDIPHILQEHWKWRMGEGGACANLTGANLTGANLTGANLTGADLGGANLGGANLVRANLTDANLVRANLTGANLAGANLTGADLVRANLTDANLVRANLTGANLASQHIIDGGERRDEYRFVGWVKAGALMIHAGCRNMTVAEYRDHNAKRGDVQMRDETASILDHIERVARVRGLIVEAAR